MAQQVEHVLGKDEVPGSNPGISSRKAQLRQWLCFCFVMELAFNLIIGTEDESVLFYKKTFCINQRTQPKER